MAMPSKTSLQLAAGAVAAYALWIGAQRNRGYQAVADVQYTAYGQDQYQRLAQQHYYQGISGQSAMDQWAHRLRVFNAYGPWGLYPKMQRWKLKTEAFINNVLLTPESLLGIGALYVAGLKPHKVVTTPARWLWNDGGMREGLRNVGQFIRNYKPAGLGQALGKFSKFMFTVPGIILGLGALALGWRFNRVYSGTERAEYFDPGGGSNQYAPWLSYTNSMIL